MGVTHRETSFRRPLYDSLLEFRPQICAFAYFASFFARFFTYISIRIVPERFFLAVDDGERGRPDTRIIQGALLWTNDGMLRTHVVTLPLLLLLLEEFEGSWRVNWFSAVDFQRFERFAIENVSDITVFLASLVAVVLWHLCVISARRTGPISRQLGPVQIFLVLLVYNLRMLDLLY